MFGSLADKPFRAKIQQCPLLALSGHGLVRCMSAFGGKMDIGIEGLHVRSLPKADIGTPTGGTSAQRL